MSIKFACPYCEKISSVPDSFAGKKGKCPACKKVIEVPDPNGEGGGDSGPGADLDLAEVSDDAHAGTGGGGGGSGEKACPFCGETIKAVAKKCKFCGEFLSKDGRKTRSGGGRGGPKPNNNLALAIIITLFCCWPVGIFAIIQAASVDSKWNAGDYRGARQAADKAKSLSMWSIGLWGAVMVLYVIIAIVANL